MSFLSLEFLLWTVAAFALYWSAGRLGVTIQNAVAVILGLVFCSTFSPSFCLFLLTEALAAYGAGLLVRRFRSQALFVTLVALLLLPLAFLKYVDFLVTSINAFGPRFDTLKLLLPVGLSFYTFMAVGYVIDVRRRTVAPQKDVLRFLAFMTFFPQLVAGPIGRAPALLPQFASVRRFDCALAVDGCRQILWGAFKKMVVADLAAASVAPVFACPTQWSPLGLWTGALIFTLQIYADFSGYSDMAVGIGKLFGIRLAVNFKCPYFATNIADFWRRWHISLTTWFRDYVYIPLGGSRCSLAKVVRNTLVVFLVSGLWHGAAWTFVLWGLVHGLLFVPKLCLRPVRLPVGLKWLLTFVAVMLAWILFRAPTFALAADYLRGLVVPAGTAFSAKLFDCLPYAALLFAAEGWKRHQEHPLALAAPRSVRWAVYFALILIVFSAHPQSSQFIYAQF